MSDRVITHKVEGHPGAMVWSAADEPEIFYLTNSRGNKRSTHLLEAKTLAEAVKAAKDWLA